jgi:hypothetical protein
MKDISEALGASDTLTDKIKELPVSAEEIGFCNLPDRRVFFVSGRISSNSRWGNILQTLKRNSVIVHLGIKLDWKVIKHIGKWTITASGKKPYIELEKIKLSIIE